MSFVRAHPIVRGHYESQETLNNVFYKVTIFFTFLNRPLMGAFDPRAPYLRQHVPLWVPIRDASGSPLTLIGTKIFRF